MSPAFLDSALPIGLVLVIEGCRRCQYAKTGSKNAVPKAAADGVKRAIGLSVIRRGHKYITH